MITTFVGLITDCMIGAIVMGLSFVVLEWVGKMLSKVF